MAKIKISQYDATAANNTDIDSINTAEGMAPSNVNNAIRELMAHLKDMDAGTQALTSPQLTSVDINGGTIDGAVIGANSAAAITGTTITGTSLVIGSADINENDFESIDGITAGTVAASKAVIVDSNKDVTGFRNVTLTGELDAGSLDVSGNIDVDGIANLDVVDIDGAVDMASTLAVGGSITQSVGDYLYTGGGNFDIKHNSASQNIVFSTTPSGGSATERARLTHDGHLSFLNDTSIIKMGLGADLQIYHEGNNSFIKDAGTGSLYLQADAGVYITNAAGSENKAIFTSDGAVTLYYDNAAKISTATGGVTVTGEMAATTMDLSSNAVIDGTALVTGVLTTTAAAVFNGGFTSNGDTVTFASANSNDPNIIIKNTTNDANAPIMDFITDKGAAGADNDSLGLIRFIGDNDAQQQTTFARILATVADATDTVEGGRIQLQVASHDGGMETGLLIVDGNAADEIDVTIGSGTSSVTSVAGNLDVTGTVNSTGEMRITNPSATSQLYLFGATGQKSQIILNEYGIRDWRIGAGTITSGNFNIGDGANNRLTIDSSGNVLVGKASSDFAVAGIELRATDVVSVTRDAGTALNVNRIGSSAGSTIIMHYNSVDVGSIDVAASSTSYNTSSDYRLKENVDYTWDATTRLKQLKPARFNFIADDTNTLVDGFLAHEVSSVVPEAITGTKDAMMDEEYVVTQAVEEVRDADDNITTAAVDAVMGTRSVPDHQGIDQSKLVPLLIKTIQELEARITLLEG